jgi:hypothetical protein
MEFFCVFNSKTFKKINVPKKLWHNPSIHFCIAADWDPSGYSCWFLVLQMLHAGLTPLRATANLSLIASLLREKSQIN